MVVSETTNKIQDILTIEVLDSDDGLKERYETITQELLQVGGIEEKDDSIEITDGILDGKFAEFLLKNDECLNKLKSYIQAIKKKGLTKEAGDNLKKLEDFLNNIGNKEKLEKDYKKFIDKLQKPKDLHKIKEQEVNRLNMYLATNGNEALNVYKTMKAILDNNQGFYDTGMKSDDIKVFLNVWNEIKKNYCENEEFIEVEYTGYKTLTSSSASLKSFLIANKGILIDEGSERDGGDITISHIEIKKNSIVNRDVIVAKLNGLNKERIDGNRALLENIDINLPTADFTKTSDGVLKYEGNEFTANDIMVFSDEISNSFTCGDFLNDTEKMNFISGSRDIIYDKIRAELLADSTVTLEGSVTGSEQEENNVEEGNGDFEYSADDKVFMINDKIVKDKIKDLGFCGDYDGEFVKFDVLKVRDYLDGIKEKKWKELQNQESSDRKVTIVAVQTVLNFLSKKDGNKKFDVKWIDGIRGWRTRKAIRAFQRKNGLKIDGKPGSKTISKIVEVLGGASINTDVDKQESVKVFDYNSLTNLDSVKVSEIFAARKEYDENDGKNDGSIRVLTLNNISDLNEKDAESLSKWEGKIYVDKLLSIVKIEENENIILKLKKLAPINGNLTIVTSNMDYYSSFYSEGLNIEYISNSGLTHRVTSGDDTKTGDGSQLNPVGAPQVSTNVDNKVLITINGDNNGDITGSNTTVGVNTNTP